MELLFGRKKTPAEMLRQHQRALQKAQRELDRERVKLEQQEKKLIIDIKKAAKANQMNACRIMAKDLVRTRRYSSKFQAMKTQLQAVSLRIQTLRSNQQMAEAMKGATKAMKSMNRQMNLPAIQKIMMEFEKESELMDMKEDMMNDLVDAPSNIERVSANERIAQPADMEPNNDAALQARLDNLRRE
ncbi:571_t:CDS:2 [Ambispora leptoticha]|uniref:571_t:CDS:1 n=1 Tax=Ambispora leptoticha TaxID=144679 RepID=A0A9N8V019_9GLOM|nr:571_t:CDS:2 [Ambispora leptoticha]